MPAEERKNALLPLKTSRKKEKEKKAKKRKGKERKKAKKEERKSRSRDTGKCLLLSEGVEKGKLLASTPWPNLHQASLHCGCPCAGALWRERRERRVGGNCWGCGRCNDSNRAPAWLDMLADTTAALRTKSPARLPPATFHRPQPTSHRWRTLLSPGALLTWQEVGDMCRTQPVARGTLPRWAPGQQPARARQPGMDSLQTSW